MLKEFMEIESKKKYFKELMQKVDKEYATKTVFPARENIFKAIELASLEDIKVVTIGQDPYPTKGEADGLAFSVNKGVAIPRSLQNIFKELHDDIGFEIPKHGSLESWAKQGVLLINTILTVEEGKANSHKKLGWQIFTRNLIKYINENKQNVCYMLWGKKAQRYAKYIDKNNNLILTAAHPSPLSCNKGFYGCKHFSKANEYLKSTCQKEIDWQI